MQKSPSIRPAEKQDIPRLELIAETTELFPPEMLADMAAGYFDRTQPDLWFVCEQDGEAVSFGFCAPERMTEGTWNLLAIGVLPTYQGIGIGKAMMQYLEDQLRNQKARVLIVETMGTPEFERTRGFYRRAGYVEEAHIREFYEAGADKVVFWKHL